MKQKVILLSGLVACLAACSPLWAAQSNMTKEVIHATRHDVSPPLRDILIPVTAPDTPTTIKVVENKFLKSDQQWQSELSLHTEEKPNHVQRSVNGPGGVTLNVSFEGLNNSTGVLPPDTNGDVSPNEYIQYINTGWAIFDKATGNMTSGPNTGNSFWNGFGGICESSNAGDPIVLYDELAGRWVFSQFTGSGNPAQCFAVSTTSDPLGPYNRYEFPFNPFNDYPHIGVWTDQGGAQSSYVFVTHDFNGQNFVGASFVAVDRNAMIAGTSADIVRFSGNNAYGAQPPHLEGTTLPAAGTCAPFVHMRTERDGYRFWNLCVDWNTPASSTITPEIPLLTDAFSQAVGGIPQANATAQLDSFGSNTMYRASVRALSTNGYLENAMVINHVTNVGNNQAGVRWAVINIPNHHEVISHGGFENDEPLNHALRMIDYSSFAPDSDHRWMGAIAMNQDGDIGLGYSVSSDSMDPEIRLTGRQFRDAPGTLSPEINCTIGATGSQTSSSSRWGDYSSMSPDPADQCTFWFTSEYLPQTSNAGWTTRICNFEMPNCGDGDFAIKVLNNQSAQVCVADGDQPSWRIDAMATNNFNQAISLSTDLIPVGTSTTYSQVTLNTLPATSTLSMQGVNTLSDGSYSFQAIGTSGPGSDSQTLELLLSQSKASAPTLTAPANNATDVSVRPTLSWMPVATAVSYFVEVATDAGFTQIIETGTVTTNSYDVQQTLTAQTSYFWRVRSQNYCGDSLTLSSASFTTGTPGACPAGTSPNLAFNDDIESGINGWTHSGQGDTWTQQAATATDGLTGMVWFAIDQGATTDQYLVSPSISVPAAQQPTTLSYMTYYDTEQDSGSGDCWDGGLLEISTDNGATWTQITDNLLLTNPYTGSIIPNPESLISGKAAWCGVNGPLESIVDLGSYAGSTIQLRYRLGTDGNTGTDGWYLDDVKVQTCQ